MQNMVAIFTSDFPHLTRRMFSSSVCCHLPRCSQKCQTSKTKVIYKTKPRRDIARSHDKTMLSTSIAPNYDHEIDIYTAVIKMITKDKPMSSLRNKRIRNFLQTVTEGWNALKPKDQERLMPKNRSESREIVATDKAPKNSVGRLSRTVMPPELQSASKEEVKKWKELLEHERRFKRMKDTFLRHHKRPRKPLTDFMMFAEQIGLLGGQHVFKAAKLWQALPEESKQVYTEKYSNLYFDHCMRKQDWEMRMREKGYNIFCSGSLKGDVEKYKTLMDFFGKDDNIELLTREDDKSAVRRWKTSKGGDLKLKFSASRFHFADEDNR